MDSETKGIEYVVDDGRQRLAGALRLAPSVVSPAHHYLRLTDRRVLVRIDGDFSREVAFATVLDEVLGLILFAQNMSQLYVIDPVAARAAPLSYYWTEAARVGGSIVLAGEGDALEFESRGYRTEAFPAGWHVGKMGVSEGRVTFDFEGGLPAISLDVPFPECPLQTFRWVGLRPPQQTQ